MHASPSESTGAKDRPACRRLWPSDAASVGACFLRLDPEGRANRFMASVSDRHALAHAERTFTAEGLVFGAFVDGVLRGVAELRPAGRRCAAMVGHPLGMRAEAAFAVERTYRRRGLGFALFERLAEAARSRGVRKLHLRCLHENRPMTRFAAKVGARMHLSGSEAEGAVRLDHPTPWSVWNELVAESLDFSVAVAGRTAEAARAR